MNTTMTTPPTSAASAGKASPSAPGWNVAAGNFFFRYRDALFPCIFLLVGLTMHPKILFGSPSLDFSVRLLGACLALLGQLIRLTTIGFDYIERGGKNNQVYASKLVQGGVYALVRNPMYIGNGLIAIGMTLLTGSPLTFMVVIPLFLFIYQAIIAAEENYLRGKFGPEFDAYCRQVNRFVPTLSRAPQVLGGMPYDWKSAFRRDLSTIAGLSVGLILVPFWRLLRLYGFDVARAAAPETLFRLALALAVYGLGIYLKKTKKFFY